MSEQPNKHYQVQITEASLHERKITVTDFVLSSIEKTPLKTPAIYIMMKIFKSLATTGAQSWRQEDILPESQFFKWFWQWARTQHTWQFTEQTRFIIKSFSWMKSLFTERVYPLQVLLCQRLITKKYTITHWKFQTLFFFSIVMKPVWLIITIIKIWHLSSHLLRRLKMTLFILNWPITPFQ